jgi:hypothetical protein
MSEQDVAVATLTKLTAYTRAELEQAVRIHDALNRGVLCLAPPYRAGSRGAG